MIVGRFDECAISLEIEIHSVFIHPLIDRLDHVGFELVRQLFVIGWRLAQWRGRNGKSPIFLLASLMLSSIFFDKRFFKLLNEAVIPGKTMNDPSVVIKQESFFKSLSLPLLYCIIFVGSSHSRKMLASLISCNRRIFACIAPH